MPTGYTAPVEDGTITDLADFALTCARGWGALIMLRDSDQSLEATRRAIENEEYLDESPYYKNSLESAQAHLDELLRMTDEEALAAAQAAADEARRRNEEMNAKWRIESARYEAMIEKVEAWEPPTPDHVGFKDFMLEQLRMSINKPYEMSLPEVNLSWRTAQVVHLRKWIEYDKAEIENRRERNESRKAWITALLDSLTAPKVRA